MNFSGFWRDSSDFKVSFYGKIYNKTVIGFDNQINDEQLIETLYKRGGCDALAVLDGAFLIIIKADAKVYIIRDRHGIGTQVYYNDRCYASSLARLQEIDEDASSANKEALAQFLIKGYISEGSSSVSGVRKLGAAKMLCFNNGHFSVVDMYSKPSVQKYSGIKDVNEATSIYKELHSEAIKRRVDGCKTTALLLSGGYDSGSNLASLRENFSGDIFSYTVGFKGDAWSEMPLAKIMSDHFSTIHHQYEIDGSEIENLPTIVSALGDPFVEGGVMVNFAAMRMIGDNKPDVILGGDGSDQYFGTTAREVALHYLISRSSMMPLVRLAFKSLSNERVDANDKLYKVRFHLDKIINILDGDLFGFQPFMMKKMLLDGYSSNVEREKRNLKSFDTLYEQHRMVGDIEKIINQVILFKASRMAELFGNNMVFPYMDKELYDFLAAVPVDFKCKNEGVFKTAKSGAVSKFLLKNAYKPLLPREITERKKQGGFAPMPIFFADKTRRNRINDFLLDSAVCKEFLNQDYVKRFVDGYQKECLVDNRWFWYRQNRAIQYFNLVTLALWWEIFVEKRKIDKL